MSTHAVKVVKLEINNHPNAERLEIATVGDYKCVVGKGEFITGDIAAYIPEQSIVPENILKELGLEGRLEGKDKNRVKAIRLRGVASQGIIYKAREGWKLDDDVAAELGITKWVPAIPRVLRGEVSSVGSNRAIKYDIENFKRYPEIFVEGEPVVITEKIHGTFFSIGIMPDYLKHPELGRIMVASKGLAARGLALKYETEKNEKNLYIRTARYFSLDTRVVSVYRDIIYPNSNTEGQPVFVMGEIFGQGVQDLKYGAKIDKNSNIGFRIFDIFIGVQTAGRFLSDVELDLACKKLYLPRVPVLYRGKYSKEKLIELTNGMETVSGHEVNIREGVVIRPTIERSDDVLGRVQLKSVSEKYLFRGSNATEYN